MIRSSVNRFFMSDLPVHNRIGLQFQVLLFLGIMSKCSNNRATSVLVNPESHTKFGLKQSKAGRRVL